MRTRAHVAGSDERSFADEIDERISGLEDWLDENAPYCKDDQAHCVDGTSERAYWHHGYMMALKDARDFLRRARRRNH